jgi:transcriptional regulator with XRE-family HTH domain
MKKLSKLKIILDTVKEHNITAYEIGKNTNLSTVAIQKILKGETKSPNEKTLDIILQFIEDAIVGSNYKGVREPVPEYLKVDTSFKDSDSELARCYKEQIHLMRKIDYLKTEISKLYDLLESHNIKFRNILIEENL